jgi:NAD(P)-dependent dehydrogenase (short-subunit alcohol dehydrogenase family)
MELSGKKALVTGGGRGIGAAVARALAERGAEVLVAARSETQVRRVAEELRAAGYGAHFAIVDVASEASVMALAETARAALGHVDVLVNNAGIATSANLRVQTLEEWNRVLAVNLTGTFLCTRAFISGMLERGFGRVVNVASVTSRMGAPYVSAYTASKHAVLGFTRSVAAEVAGKGVTVNCVCPGYVDTDMTTASIAGVVARGRLDAEQALAAILKTVGQPRLVTPEEVAHLVASLCAPLAGAITAQAVVIDGGGLTA